MLDLIWEPDAFAQYEAIVAFIADHRTDAAERMMRLFIDSLQRARRFPEIGRPGRVEGTRELIVHPNYIVVYRIIPGAIDILRVLHARQLYP